MNPLPLLRDLVLAEPERRVFLTAVRAALPPELYERIRAMTERLPELVQLLEQKNLSLARLRQLVFGAATERARHVCGRPDQGRPPRSKRRPGHGRRGQRTYTGARRVGVPHGTYQPGARCPACQRGKLRQQAQPATVVTVSAQPPVGAVIHELERLRCDTCGTVFTATLPPEVSPEKYDAKVGALIGLLRYGLGLPFYRLERLQASVGVPLPASIQWAQAERAATALEPVVDHLIYLGAQAAVVYSDDTTMRVGQLRAAIQAEEKPARTGVFTTGIVCAAGEHPIQLFFTGRQHAGENLARVLDQRAPGLVPPLHMCDGLASNAPKGHATQTCSCVLHGRRNFVELRTAFPEACQRVVTTFSQVYQVEAECQGQHLSPAARLQRHQTDSQPVLTELKDWFIAQQAAKNVEPNSGLGQAINYMLERWEPLTRFLTVPGAPIDNNITERLLKTAILHRKNSLHYRTARGAAVGDCFMSVIQTCIANRINPFDYLVAVGQNRAAVGADPGRWLPWNYQAALAGRSPPA